jgi:hypothetical protein
MGAFEDLHRDRVTGSLAMFDRMIFKGRLTALPQGERGQVLLVVPGRGAQGLHPVRQVDRPRPPTPCAAWPSSRGGQ